MAGKKQKTKSGSSSRGPNFTVAQDLLLCEAWSHTTNDSAVGTDQSGEAYWVKAQFYWLTKAQTFPERTPDALMQRFSRIKTGVSKFCGYLAQVDQLSGFCDEDKIAKAKEMYYEFELSIQEGKKKPSKSLVFAFEHCWNVLKKDQKWLELMSVKKCIDLEIPIQLNPVHINLDGEDEASIPNERPIGRKLAKEGRTKRKGKFVYDSSPILEKIDETVASNEKKHNVNAAMFVESDKKMDVYLDMQKEGLDLKKRRLGMEEKKFVMEEQMFNINLALKEAEFMKVDIASLTDPDEIEFHRSMRKKINAKHSSS